MARTRPIITPSDALLTGTSRRSDEVLVYGDQHEKTDPRKRLHEIGECLELTAAMPCGIERHSKLVGVLIEAGKLLQGVADADFEEANFERRSIAADALGEFTRALARAVLMSWDRGEIPVLPAILDVGDLPKSVELRTPEGFAFYALYPEAYIDAARRLKLRSSPCVIGIRSIGTTLGAVVAAALGTDTLVTVRPTGDPFAREIRLGPQIASELLENDHHYIIVDEGPGQSGSSFGAVADWLENHGVPLERIAFMPSHPGALGPRASDAHRRRWTEAERSPADLGRRLPQLLNEWLGELVENPQGPIQEISGGEWRRHKYADQSQWPAAIPQWERRKFQAVIGGATFLLKFAGLGRIGERKLAMARRLHSLGVGPEPIGLLHGFLVERWLEDARVLGSDEKPVEEVGRYIGARARLFPADESSGATLEQLLQMCRRNISLELGGEHASSFTLDQAQIEILSSRLVRSRTDNKLDRHEWLRRTDNRLIKSDALDHHSGHDLIGCQDIAWDAAGAIVEFDLDEVESRQLIEAAERASLRSIDQDLLEFYLIAYCSFRLGQSVVGAGMCGQSAPEVSRLIQSAERYRARLRDLLHQSAASTRSGPRLIEKRNEPDGEQTIVTWVDEEEASTIPE